MANIKVKDLTDTATISSDNQLMVLTNDANNTVQNITVENFNQNIISTDADNGITQGTDGNLYVDNSDTGVTAGTYQYPQNLVVNEKGQITSVESGSPAAVPIATTSQAGIVKPDGTTITVEADGTITALLRNIGEIVASTIPLTDAGLHLLDGSLISGAGIYSAFVDYIASIYDVSANYFCTEAEWQQSVTTYGICGKFVYDSINNTVRLPLYSNKIYTKSISSTAPVVGNGNALGITNGTRSGGWGVCSYDWSSPQVQENSYNPVGTTSSLSSFTVNQAIGIVSEGANSGIIADLANITNSLDGYYYIVVATSTKTDIQVDIDEIATDLNGKADVDLSNVLASKGILSETYTNGASWYRVYSDGWCIQGGYLSHSDTTTAVTLLKPYSSTNYGVSTEPIRTAYNANSDAYTINSGSQFTVYWGTGGDLSWFAYGYIS